MFNFLKTIKSFWNKETNSKEKKIYFSQNGELNNDFSWEKYSKILNKYGEIQKYPELGNWLKIKIFKNALSNKHLEYLILVPGMFYNLTRTFEGIFNKTRGKVVFNIAEFNQRAKDQNSQAYIPSLEELKAIATIICGNAEKKPNKNYEKLGFKETYWCSTRLEDKDIFYAYAVSFRNARIIKERIDKKHNVTCVIRCK